MLCRDECERVSHIHCGIVQRIRAQFLLKLQASLGGSFEAMSSLDKSSFVVWNELWERAMGRAF